MSSPALPGLVTGAGAGQIVWLASYPKSGNTWLRSLLTAYRQGDARALDINRLDSGGAASRRIIDELLGISTSDLTADEVRALLPQAYRSWSTVPAGPHFLKTHDAYALTCRGEPMFPIEATRGVVHLVRDPRDVALSAMHHWGIDLDRTIGRMNAPDHWLGVGLAPGTLVAQQLRDWSTHTRSWLASPLPRLSLRYEDMLADPLQHFARILAFCGMDVDQERARQAVSACELDKLKAQELAGGFRERHRGSTALFFRSGRAGDWRTQLSADQQARLLDTHGKLMAELGYLDTPYQPWP